MRFLLIVASLPGLQPPLSLPEHALIGSALFDAALPPSSGGAPSQPEQGKCTKVHDVSVSKATAFPHDVRFELGKNDVRAFDRIVIKEVRATTERFEVGGMYLVRGEYTLTSANEAHLMLTVTATEKGQGCTSGNSRGRLAITRGSGTFELVTKIAYTGHPHVWFSSDGGKGSSGAFGGVYFGKGAFLKK